MKNVLVTGGAGFLGSHLCENLLAIGHKVICVDNLFSCTRKNIAHLLKEDQFEFVFHDVTLPFTFRVDQIYNLACPASPIHYQRDPVTTVKTNVMGAIHVLELAHRMNSRVLQASTSEVYGDPEVHPQTEHYLGSVNPIGPRGCYDEGKRIAETLFWDYHRQYGVDIRIARLFNTYGPNMAIDDGRVVSNFIVQALKGEPLTITGDGFQTRSFCYVTDTIRGLKLLMETPEYFNPVNLGKDQEITIQHLAQMICELMGKPKNFEYLPETSDDPVRRKPDISRAKSLLSWRPVVSLKDGLEITIDYFADRLAQ